MKLEIEILTNLKLFEGLSLSDLNRISQEIRFNHKTFKAGKIIKNIYDKCDEMIFVNKGTVVSELKGSNTKFTFVEEYTPPYMLEAYSLFGLSPRYTKKYIAKTETDILSIDKKTLLELLGKYDIFNLNYLNMLCSYAQLFRHKNLLYKSESIKDKIIQFAIRLSETYSGDKVLYIKKEDLAAIIHETRIRTSQAIQELCEEGYLSKQRGILIFKEHIFKNKQLSANFIL